MSPATPRHAPHLASSIAGAIRARFARHEFRILLVQIIKSVFAATLAWWLSTTYLHTDFPFLAPWTALLSIHPTTYRTLTRAAQTLIATILGIAVTYSVAAVFDIAVWTYALALLIGLLLARLRWIREEGITVATMAIFLLSDGFSDDSSQLADRVLEIVVGVAVGCAVNLLIFPPFRDQQATWLTGATLQRFGEILRGIGESQPARWSAEDIQDWLRTTTELSNKLTHAWSQVNFARESRRINPRRLTIGEVSEEEWEEALRRTFTGLSHLQILISALAEFSPQDTPRNRTDTSTESEHLFLASWLEIARRAGQALEAPDSRAFGSADLRRQLANLRHESSSREDFSSAPWPLYGALLNSLEQVLSLIDIRYPQ
ncbi:FUSC family protein [Corynebacterium flavescens]|uniref:FUSC family protein n=1 Tax=Corynebacterium flavescens TaxID=28028 RepID=UPI003FCFB934